MKLEVAIRLDAKSRLSAAYMFNIVGTGLLRLSSCYIVNPEHPKEESVGVWAFSMRVLAHSIILIRSCAGRSLRGSNNAMDAGLLCSFCVCFFVLYGNRQLRRELATELVRYTEVTFSAVSSAS